MDGHSYLFMIIFLFSIKTLTANIILKLSYYVCARFHLKTESILKFVFFVKVHLRQDSYVFTSKTYEFDSSKTTVKSKYQKDWYRPTYFRKYTRIFKNILFYKK